MKVKILCEAQKRSSLFKHNLNHMVNNSYTKLLEHDDLSFNFFNYLSIDESWDFEGDQSYIFPVFHDPFVDYIDDIIKFVQEHSNLFGTGRLKLVFIDPFEGNEFVTESISYFMSKFYNGIPCYFINCNYKLKNEKHPFKFVYNDSWVSHIRPYKDIIEYKPERIYINLTRRPRYHRCMLMQKLIENNKVHIGYNTWGDGKTIDESYLYEYPHNQILSQQFDTLDCVDINGENPTDRIPIEHCIKSFFFLVTETHYTSNILFFSEKIYKPIAIGMPFMCLGNPGSLELLRERGFLTFGEWFNENYDNDMPLENRINVILGNIHNINEMSNGKKIGIREEMREYLIHNQKLLDFYASKNHMLEKLKLIAARQL